MYIWYSHFSKSSNTEYFPCLVRTRINTLRKLFLSFSVAMCLIKLISKYMQVSQIPVVFQASKIWRNVFSVQKIIFQRSVYKIKKYNFRTVSQPMRNIESRNSSFNLNLNLNLTGSIFSDSVSFLFLVTGKSHYETKS